MRIRLLRPNLHKVARPNRGQRFEHGGHQREVILESGAPRTEHDDRDARYRDILLIPDVAIRGDEHIVASCSCTAKEFAVEDTSLTEPGDRYGFVHNKDCRDLAWH